MVQFRLCEVPSASALAFIGYARGAISEASGSEDGLELPESVVSRLGAYLTRWEQAAMRGPVMSFSEEIPTEELEFLTHAFLQISDWATRRADERGFDVSPPEGDEFYAALSDAAISALEFSGEDSAQEFAIVLRNNWPRVDRLDGGAP